MRLTRGLKIYFGSGREAPLRHGYAVPPPPGGGGKRSCICVFAYHLAPPKGELSAKPTERGQTFKSYGMRGDILALRGGCI